MFVDIAKINIKAGNGGNGAVAFHREKYVAAGGPDGGDGGRGGNIVFQADDSLATLSDFRYKRKYKAPSGEYGRGARQNGKKGQEKEKSSDLFIPAYPHTDTSFHWYPNPRTVIKCSG